MSALNESGEHEGDADLPLVWRIINDHVRGFIKTACATARAGNGTLNEYERGFAAAVDQMQYLHLSGVDYRVTPQLAEALWRAGLLTKKPPF